MKYMVLWNILKTHYNQLIHFNVNPIYFQLQLVLK